MRMHKIKEGKQRVEGDKIRENNFTFLRLLASLFVFTGHMGVISGKESLHISVYPFEELGVFALFLISGCLITKSWLSDPHPLRYAIRRFFRLWPPYAVMVLSMAFLVGPLLSDKGVRGYFTSDFWIYLKNLRLYIVYALPGVFVNVPVSNTVNGSLWTMPVEVVLYILAPVIVLLFQRKLREKFSLCLTAALAIVLCGCDICLRAFSAEARVVVYGITLIPAFHLVVLFVIGMLFTYDEIRKYLNIQVAGVAACVLLMFQYSEPWLSYLMLYLLYPYIIFSFAFAPHPVFRCVGQKVEPSYGIYLYGFLFQQIYTSWIQQNGIEFGYLVSILICIIPTLAASALSYYFIEKPSIRVAKYLIKKIEDWR